MPATVSLEVGQTAPEFRLKGPGGQFVSLSEYRGTNPVVVVFYPLAFSPVCSHQLPDLEKRMGELRERDAVVFGISVDSHYANTEFANKLRLSFSLLSDFSKQTSVDYGVLMPETGYSGRATFVVDKNGVIAYKDHAPTTGMDQVPSIDGVLGALDALKK
jgi:peroxiredoxin (alkyl hydroperoxide reductase subunit C)